MTKDELFNMTKEQDNNPQAPKTIMLSDLHPIVAKIHVEAPAPTGVKPAG